MSTHPLSGLYFLLEGFKLIFKPRLKPFVLLPLGLNIILFSAAFWGSQHYFSQFNHWLGNYLPHWLHWIEAILWLLFLLIFFLIITYTFVTLANLVGAPLNSLLSAEVELYLSGKKLEKESWQTILKNLPRALGRQLAVLGYYLPRALLLLLLLFIPIVQLVAAPLFFIFNAWFITFQMLDYPSDNHHVPLQLMKLQLKKKRILALGFGISVLLFSMIPLVNFFVIPAAVAGATKLWLEEFQPAVA